MRQNRLGTYLKVSQHRWPVYPVLNVFVNHPGPGVLKRSLKSGLATLRQHTTAQARSVITRAMNLGHLESKLHVIEGKLDHLINIRDSTSVESEPLTEVCKIGQEMHFFSYPSYKAGLADSVWRMENDYYLTRVASFRQGDAMIDVGAYVGVLSIALAKRYPFLTVYALEPDPLNYASLKQNIERNGIKNVIALNIAVSADGRPRMLYTSARDSSWATTDARMMAAQGAIRAELVETITLDGLFEKFNISHCRLLKMTALGAAYAALEAFRKRGSIDLLCGEIDLRECSKAKLQMISWQIARQHFWRTITRTTNGDQHTWIHELPRKGEFCVPVPCAQVPCNTTPLCGTG
jgi:FkbM family methyltransferase